MPLSDISPRHLEMLRLSFRLLRRRTAAELEQAWKGREAVTADQPEAVQRADARIAQLEQVMLDLHPLGVLLHAEPKAPQQ